MLWFDVLLRVKERKGQTKGVTKENLRVKVGSEWKKPNWVSSAHLCHIALQRSTQDPYILKEL
jgi:hypothetical protein